MSACHKFLCGVPYGMKTLLICRKTPSLLRLCFAPNLVVQLVRVSSGAVILLGSISTPFIKYLYSSAS